MLFRSRRDIRAAYAVAGYALTMAALAWAVMRGAKAGQPFSLDNLRKVSEVTKAAGVLLVLDASLLGDNLHFLKQREDICKNMEIKDIMKELADHSDIVYFSARKLGAARGGAIITSNEGLFERMKPLVPLFEGFLTYN